MELYLSAFISLQNNFYTNNIEINVINKVKNVKARNKNVQFIWTTGHSKIHRNYLAVQYAKNTPVSDVSKLKSNKTIDIN